MRTKTITVSLLILLGVAVLSIGLSRAETGERQAVQQLLGGGPGRFHYQGLLLDSEGNPWPDGDYGLIFSLYDRPTATAPLWSEAWTVSVRNGLFSVTLGLQNLLPALREGQRLWLGIVLPDRGEIFPRPMLLASPSESGRPALLYLDRWGLPLEADGRWHEQPFP
ncbi:MAG: hypothetical protein ACP5OO_00080 [Chloroflexia bacterium]